MEYRLMDHEQLADVLYRAETNSDSEKVKKIYEELNERDDIDGDFWKDVFSESEQWVLEIVIEVRNPLYLHEVILIPDDDVFEAVMNDYNIKMTDIDNIVKDLVIKGNKERLKIILQCLDTEEFNRIIQMIKKDLDIKITWNF